MLSRNFWDDFDFWTGTGNLKWFNYSQTSLLNVEVVESGEEYGVTVEVPGVKRDAIDVLVENNQLRITVKPRDVKADRKVLFGSLARTYGTFVYPLPQSVNTEHIDAKLEDGLLTVVLKKEVKAKSNKVTIR